jgi:mRNA interferase MazF
MEIKQYQIIIVNLDPTIGSEIRKTRPCIVISPNEMNKHLRTIAIAPITSKSKDYMTRVKFELDGNDNWIAIDQIRTIDMIRIIKVIGELGIKEIKKVKLVIKETFVD